MSEDVAGGQRFICPQLFSSSLSEVCDCIHFPQKTLGRCTSSVWFRRLFCLPLFLLLLESHFHTTQSNRNRQMKLATTTASALLFTSANTGIHAQRSLRKKCLVWTKLGLEQIPFDKWRDFSDDDVASLYIKNFPFPGDHFTLQHYESWKQ